MPQDPVQGPDRRSGAPTLDLETLPRKVRSAVEAMVAGCEVTLRREGRDVGVLAFRPSALEGTVVPGPQMIAAESAPPEAVSDGVTVVATATKLSDAARRRLSDELGPGLVKAEEDQPNGATHRGVMAAPSGPRPASSAQRATGNPSGAGSG